MIQPDASERQMTLARDFNYPQDLIWRAYTAPEHFSKWFGPEGFTITLDHMDVREGGSTQFVMHGPDGTDYPNYMAYRVVQPVTRLEFDHGKSPNDPDSFDVKITLGKTDAGTKVTSQITFPTVDAFEKAKGFGAMELGMQTFAKLDAHLHMMMEESWITKPAAEHEWLHQLVGDWTFEAQGEHGIRGDEQVRGFDLWIQAEAHAQMNSGRKVKNLMTLGYDIEKKAFVGTWVGSMMSNLWVYEGELDSSGKVLVLNSRGPSMDGGGKQSNYRDIIEIVSSSERILRAEVQADDGTWAEFMRTTYRRI